MAYAAQPVDDVIAKPDPTHPLAKTLPRLRIGDKYRRWLSNLVIAVDSKPTRQVHRSRTGLTASIATTALAIGSVTAGIWAISYTVRVTTPGSVSSSIRVTIAWTERSVAQTQQGAALTGNLTTTREGDTFIIRVDGATTISYSTTYADGGGAQAMNYSLDIVAVQLAADAT